MVILAESHNLMRYTQKYSKLRCLLRVKGLAICFYLGWSGSILQFRQNVLKVGSKSWLLTCSSYITLSLPSYTGSALKRELNYCNSYLSLLYFQTYALTIHSKYIFKIDCLIARLPNCWPERLLDSKIILNCILLTN